MWADGIEDVSHVIWKDYYVQYKPWVKGVEQTITGVFADACALWPDRIYIDMCGDRAYTFAEIDQLSNQITHGLAGIGIGKGSSICTMLDNHIDHIICVLGILKLGAFYVPLNTALRGDFLKHQLADSNASALIMEGEFLSRLDVIRQDLPDLQHIISRGAPMGAGVAGEIQPLSAIWSDDSSAVPDDAEPTDVCMVLYTSGTTGPSKGCMVSHNYLCQYIRDLNVISDLRFDDRLYTSNPLFHLNALGMIFTATHTGARVIVDQRFSVSNFWNEIQRSGATVVSLLGAMIPLLANAEDNEVAQACFGQIRRMLGAPFTPETQQKWRDRFGVPIARNTGYGLTEVCFVFMTPPDSNPPPGASGMCAPHIDARIIGDDGEECPPGVPGELIVRPLQPNVMFEGYWKRPADTLKVMQNLWFHTGDIGMIDAEGWFFFVDRKKDYLRRRGENISSFELEATFMAHEAIQDVAVHAVPSAMTEDDVKVTAVLQAGAVLEPAELFRWSMERLPYYAMPRYIEFRAALPYNASGRVLKHQLRDEGVTPLTWDQERSDIKVSKR